MDAPTPELVPSEPRFVTGSTMRHVVVMTLTASVGLMAVFLVDLLSLLYVSWLGDARLTAAVGLSTIVLFIGISINVGLMIAVAALVSRALGRGDREAARRLAASSLVIMTLFAGLVVVAAWPFIPRALALIGADDETRAVAARFIAITLPSNVLMALGMGFSGVLRAVGDAKRAMYVTLTGGVVTAFLDPLLIFGLGLGVDGAAIATVISRVVFAAVGWHGAVRVHDLVARPRVAEVVADARPMLGIALPAVLTNIATPVASAFVAGVIARFGDTAIAGNAVIDRLTPVAFGGLFALSGAVGPILGQNWGALRFDRMRQAMRDAVLFTAIYVGIVWVVLAASSEAVVTLFHAEGVAAELVRFFCYLSGPMWFFIGLLFVANAAFNNLGSPLLSTAFNWGRATLGTVPFAYLGAAWGGPVGALVGVALGSVVFGVLGIFTAFWTIRRLERAA
jgi:putative MATE family efflux protein